MSLLETDVPVRNVITTDPEQAKALEQDIRAKILDMLVDEPLTIEEIQAELERRGEEKAETTVRHHVNVLRDAGMVEIARLEEAGGGTRKYYQSNTRVFSYQLPDDVGDRLGGVQAQVNADLKELIEALLEEHGELLESVAREMKPCPYCETQHYEEFIIRELINRALTALGEDDDLAARLG